MYAGAVYETRHSSTKSSQLFNMQALPIELTIAAQSPRGAPAAAAAAAEALRTPGSKKHRDMVTQLFDFEVCEQAVSGWNEGQSVMQNDAIEVQIIKACEWYVVSHFITGLFHSRRFDLSW